MTDRHLHTVQTQEVLAAPTPGTELLYDSSGSYGELQHVRRGDSHTLLVPQPSLTDPNDPLRWPAWKKWVTFSNGLAYSFLGGVTGPLMAAAVVDLATDFNVPVEKIVWGVGATLACQGVFTIAWM